MGSGSPPPIPAPETRKAAPLTPALALKNKNKIAPCDISEDRLDPPVRRRAWKT